MKCRFILFILILWPAIAASQTPSTYLTFSASAPAAGTLNPNNGATNQSKSGSVYEQLSWSKTGTVATCSVRVDSSTDGVTWNTGDVISAQTCTSNGSSSVVNVTSLTYVRINFTALSGGGTVKAIYKGYTSNPAGGVTSVTGTANQINSTGGATPVLSLATASLGIPSAVTGINAYGDSITSGFGLVPTSRNYASLISNSLGITLSNNFGVSGFNIGQITGEAYPVTSALATASVAQIGANDIAQVFGSQTNINLYVNAAEAFTAWLGLLPANKITGGSITYVGTWSSQTQFGLAGQFSSTLNDTATGTVSGSTIYVAGWAATGFANTFDVLVDGVSTGPYSFTGYNTIPYCVRVSGLSNTSHTVVVKVTAGGGEATVQWMGGNTGSSFPTVIVGNTIPRPALNEESTVVSMNTGLATMLANLKADGLSVIAVDDHAALASQAPSFYQADSIHPSGIGAALMAGTFLNTIWGLPASTFAPFAALNVPQKSYQSSPLGILGSTSGQVTLSAPAVAGTSSNPLTISNILSLPSGSNGSPAIELGGNSAGIYSPATNHFAVADTGAYAAGTTGTNWLVNAGGVLGFTTNTTSSDTAFSRDSAGVVDLGNGTTSNKSGTLNLTILNALTGFQVNGAATSGNVLKGNGTNFVSAALPANMLMSVGSGTATIAGSTTSFMFAFGGYGLGAAELTREMVLPVSGVLSNMTVCISTAQPSGGDLTLTYRMGPYNGTMVSQALLVDIPTSSVVGCYSDVTHSFTYTAGQAIDIQAVNASGSTSANITSVSAAFQQ